MRDTGVCHTIGKLDKRVTFKSAVHTQSASGEPLISYATAFETWAFFRELKGKERMALGQESGQAEAQCIIRHGGRTVKADMVVTYDGSDWEICGPPVNLGNKERIEVYLKRRRADV